MPMQMPAMKAERRVNQISFVVMRMYILYIRWINCGAKIRKSERNGNVSVCLFGKIPLRNRENTHMLYEKSRRNLSKVLYLCDVR